MTGRWVVDRTASVNRAAMLVKKGADVIEVCEAQVQVSYSNPETMTTRQFDSFVADVNARVARFGLGSIIQEVR